MLGVCEAGSFVVVPFAKNRKFNIGLVCLLFLHQYSGQEEKDLEYVAGQKNVFHKLGLTFRPGDKEWHLYPQAALFKSIEASVQTDSCFYISLLLGTKLNYHHTWIYFSNRSQFCQKEDKNVVSVLTKLCSPYQLQNELDLQKQRDTLLQFHLENEASPPTPLNTSKSNLFFVANLCTEKIKPHIFTSCTFVQHSCHTMMWREWWEFNMNTLFLGNISFSILDLKYTRNCSAECFLIRRSLLTYLECNYDEEMLVLFCGYKPRTCVSPHTHTFVVMTRHSYRDSRSLELQFSVISSSVKSAHYQQDLAFHEKHVGQLWLKLLLFGQHHITVNLYLIQTEKHLKLHLHKEWTQRNAVWLFDGPGPLCLQHTIFNSSVISLSSFQTLVSVANFHGTEKLIGKGLHFFSTLEIDKMFHLHKGKPQIIHSSDEIFGSCKQKSATHCVISITTSHLRQPPASCSLKFPYIPYLSCQDCCELGITEWFVNTTVEHFKFEGYTSDHCLYGGISIHQPDAERPNIAACRLKSKNNKLLQNMLHQHENLCRQNDKLESFKAESDFLNCDGTDVSSNLATQQILVSNHNSILVTFYFFDHYVKKFELVLQVEPTPCKGIFLSLDHATHLTHSSALSPLHLKYKPASSILEDFTDVFFDYQPKVKEITHNCLVVHLKYDTDRNYCSNTYRNNFLLGVLQPALFNLKVHFYLAKGNTQYSISDDLSSFETCSGKVYGSMGDILEFGLPTNGKSDSLRQNVPKSTESAHYESRSALCNSQTRESKHFHQPKHKRNRNMKQFLRFKSFTLRSRGASVAGLLCAETSIIPFTLFFVSKIDFLFT